MKVLTFVLSCSFDTLQTCMSHTLIVVVLVASTFFKRGVFLPSMDVNPSRGTGLGLLSFDLEQAEFQEGKRRSWLGKLLHKVRLCDLTTLVVRRVGLLGGKIFRRLPHTILAQAHIA